MAAAGAAPIAVAADQVIATSGEQLVDFNLNVEVHRARPHHVRAADRQAETFGCYKAHE